MNILRLFLRKPCTHVGLAKDVLGKLDMVALEDGGFTTFWLMRCQCDRIVGHPDENYRLALEYGTEETKKKIRELEAG